MKRSVYIVEATGTQDTRMLTPDCDMNHPRLKAAFTSSCSHLFFCSDGYSMPLTEKKK